MKITKQDLNTRSGKMKISKTRLKEIIKEELNEIIDLPTDYETPPSDQEIEMEKLTVEFENQAKEAWFRDASIHDPFTDETTLLDEFLALLGNRVVSGEVEKSAADDIVQNIHRHLE
jgi:hypothetical protein